METYSLRHNRKIGRSHICVTCHKQIPAGRAGRKCEDCRTKADTGMAETTMMAEYDQATYDTIRIQIEGR